MKRGEIVRRLRRLERQMDELLNGEGADDGPPAQPALGHALKIHPKEPETAPEFLRYYQ